MKPRILLSLTLFILVFVLQGIAQNKSTVEYIRRDDTVSLKMDIYQPDALINNRTCILFVHGGAFFVGTRDFSKYYAPYFKFFTDNGFTVVSIDYRLGLKGQKRPSVWNRKPLIHAIDIAVEDLFEATKYLIIHATELGIDTSKIILNGESAGAITVLQGDYEIKNRFENSKLLPATFQYAGVISFAGAVYSTHGALKYLEKPAPTLFFHGSKDKFVPYKKIRLFREGIFGSEALVNVFIKKDYYFQFYSFQNVNHEVAVFPQIEYREEILKFIKDCVWNKKSTQLEIYVVDNKYRINPKMSLKNYMK
ncbi:MAG TPA: alpha/beta hydrolase fold domain-containing protein [Bacteroidales bacterium]|jgi:dipeptidyl aminopeptidase/acylaminoacyl peptidase|nr:alpha/beta hydrolase fold domain-containing protein [Bacteroidales bacterium]HPS71670.1 alpha/beta hydrolase fold domain-containing protein [Bacteroidales bacterium]